MYHLINSDPVILRNIPRMKDVETMIAVLEQLGVKAEWLSEDTLRLQTPQVTSHEAAYELVSTMRASILVLGPLLARVGKAKVSLPGGCAIGSRPVDQHLKGLKELGADLTVEHGYVFGEVGPEGLVGGSIRTDMVTVGGTEQFLMSAALAKGTTVLENAAREPEVVDWPMFLFPWVQKSQAMVQTALKSRVLSVCTALIMPLFLIVLRQVPSCVLWPQRVVS